jgi:hypothetical protein
VKKRKEERRKEKKNLYALPEIANGSFSRQLATLSTEPFHVEL